MSRAARAAAAAFGAVLTVIAVAGCTGAPAPAAPDHGRVVSDAVAATMAAGSARAAAELGTFAGPVQASGPVRFEPFAADLTATVSGRQAAVRAIGDRSWVEFGGRWRPVAPGIVPVGALPGAVRAASTLRDVVAEGPDVVRDPATGDVPATRYRGAVDLEAAASADPAGAGALRQLATLVTPRPSVAVWVGPDGRVAQLRIEPDGGDPVTVRLTKFGEPVDVSPPPA